MMYNEYLIDAHDSEEVKKLKREILSLQAQLDIERNRTQKMRGGNLLLSEPIDLYQGEQLDFILSVLEQVKNKCSPESRPYDIICSILSLNKVVGRGEEILKEVSTIFKRGGDLTESDISKLEKLGFRYISSKKHPKLEFCGKYKFAISGTPGEQHHGSRNKLAEINKCLAISLKI